MSEVNLYKIDDNIRVCYTGRKVVLPPKYIADCEAHWLLLMKTGKKYFRGDIFTVNEVIQSQDNITLAVELTDYAHFLYTIHKNVYEEHDCRVIYTSALVETADGKYVIGVMGEDTFAPQKLQLFGGGIDKGDLKGDEIDLEHSIKKEIAEELGIDANDSKVVKQFRPYLLKEGGRSNFFSAIFKLNLLIDETSLTKRFESHNRSLLLQGIKPELSSLLFVASEQKSIEDDIINDKREKDENLIPTLQAAIGTYPVKTFCEQKNQI